jgi:hypothetical protein
MCPSLSQSHHQSNPMSGSYAYATDASGRPYSQSMPSYGYPQPFTPPSGGQIAPGSITYTTSMGHDGRVLYHPFKYVFQLIPLEIIYPLPIASDRV